jgi:hypothetical protein
MCSYRYAMANPDELAAFGGAYFSISRATMAKSIARESPNLHSECDVDLDGLRQAVDLQLRLRAFSTPLRVEDIVDLRFLPANATSNAPANA